MFLNIAKILNELFPRKSLRSLALNMLIFLFIFLSFKNIALCETFADLDSFLLRGHTTRIMVLRDTVENTALTLEQMQLITRELRSVIEVDTYVSNPFVEDTGIPSSSFKAVPVVYSFLLFLFLSLIGFSFFKLGIISAWLPAYAYISLQKEALAILILLEDPVYIEAMSQLYTKLSDCGIFSD